MYSTQFRKHRQIGRIGFTLIELLVVIAIISLLASIIMPSLSKARDLAKRLVCINNLKNLGVAQHLRWQDHENRMSDPWSGRWWEEFSGYYAPFRWGAGQADKAWFCPEAVALHPVPPAVNVTYAMSIRVGSYYAAGVVKRLEDFNHLSEKMLHGDSPGNNGGWNSVLSDISMPAFFPAENIHLEGTNFNFLDGHVESIAGDDIPTAYEDEFWAGD